MRKGKKNICFQQMSMPRCAELVNPPVLSGVFSHLTELICLTFCKLKNEIKSTTEIIYFKTGS